MAQATAQNTPAPSATAQTPAPPAPPGAPALPSAITAASESGNIFTMPRTAGEIRAMRNMRSELSSQLESVAERREDLANDLQGADPAARTGLTDRMALLDRRILQLEQDIATTGALVARAQVQIPTTAAPDGRGPFNNNFNANMTPIGVVFTIFVLFPLAIAIARNFWRRGSHRGQDAVVERENTERLQRLEQAVDTIAVEMERVSEGQRFVTKLLSESAKREKSRIESGGH